MKRVLSIQDLSCVGKCSLSVALPVLSAMGCECSALPTAVLSTHTAFPDPHRRMLTGDIGAICRHWQSIGVSFDAVSVGYLADPAQAEAVAAVLDTFKTLTVIDPAMGDHGRLYSGITRDHIDAMKGLCAKGQILIPNVTEAAFLTGTPYQETADPAYFQKLTDGMLAFGPETVVLTGVSLEAGKTGLMAAFRDGEPFIYQKDRIPRQLHGTGDIFCAVFTGSLMAGRDIPGAAALAARFVEKVIAATPEASPFGAAFETQLPWLWDQL